MTSQLDLNSRCPDCKEPIYREIRGHVVGVMCSCRVREREDYERRLKIYNRRKKLERLRDYSMMDRSFYECRFENFKLDESNRKVYDLALKYCENWETMKRENVGFLFYGRPGVGKSYLSFCIANRLLEKLVPVIAMSTIDIINKIFDGYGKHGAMGEKEVIDSLVNADLLVLDDLGAEYGKEKSKQIIYSILDKRSRLGLPTIVTTNVEPDSLRKKLMQADGVNRIEDRLFEICYPVRISGESKRVENVRKKERLILDLLG